MLELNYNGEGRVIIPDNLKKDKTILSVIEGRPNILNCYGDRLSELRDIINNGG